jgi:predicted O-methyltransferase YrrM
MKSTLSATLADYERIFEAERSVEYPVVDEIERRFGYKCNREKIESAARILACPLKAHSPNWQHGRVLYALASDRLESAAHDSYVLLDIGTAKGYSALCLRWSLGLDPGIVYSVDVLDPHARVRRNSVFELDGYKTVPEFLAQWPEAGDIRFEQSTGIYWLQRHHERIHVAFVDGKHTGMVVSEEGHLLADRQQPGDVVMFDDVQLPDVGAAVRRLDAYKLEYVQVRPERMYAIGVRR